MKSTKKIEKTTWTIVTRDYSSFNNSAVKIETMNHFKDLIHALLSSKSVEYRYTSYWHPVICRYYYMRPVNYPPMAILPSCLGGNYLLTLS